MFIFMPHMQQFIFSTRDILIDLFSVLVTMSYRWGNKFELSNMIQAQNFSFGLDIFRHERKFEPRWTKMIF